MDRNMNKQDLVITRVFDIPAELVWKAWTDPKLMVLWWGPAHFTSPRCEIDLREGGKYLFCMRAPEEQGGIELYSAGVYTKIIPLKHLEFTQSMADKDGNIIDPSEAGFPDYPKEIKFEVEFEAKDCQTVLTIREYGWTIGKMADLAALGMNQSLDKLRSKVDTGTLYC